MYRVSIRIPCTSTCDKDLLPSVGSGALWFVLDQVGSDFNVRSKDDSCVWSMLADMRDDTTDLIMQRQKC